MKSTALLIAASLCVAAPLAAQQPAPAAPTPPAAPAAPPAPPAPEVSAPATDSARTGPRLAEPVRTVRASYRESSAASMHYRDSHTITISTLALVLIIVIVILLVR